MNIRLIQDSDKDLWDNWITHHSDAVPYSLFAWRQAVEEAYGHKPYYFIAEEGGKVTGALPFIFLKPPFMAGELVSLPYCDMGNLLGDSPNIEVGLIREAVLLAQKLKAGHIEIRSTFPLSKDQCMNLPVRVLSHKVRMMLDLPASSEILLNDFKSKLRSQITKAERNGLEFSWGSSEKIDDFYLVFSRNMRDIGSPVHSKKWFQKIFYYFEQVKVGLVYYMNKPIGAGIMVFTEKNISIPWASTLREYNRLGPNMLIYWNFLKYASDSGYSQFDFGRSSPGESTYKFKEQWGAKPVPLYWNYIDVANKSCTDIKQEISFSAKRKTVERLWQKLPLGIANYIGPSIRKHISL